MISIKSLLSLIILLFLIPQSVYSQINLIEVDQESIKGKFDMILYGNGFINDPETFVILDNLADDIKILPYSSTHKYKIFHNVTEDEALKIIKDIMINSSVSFLRFRAIKDSQNIAGFEIKPVYFPWIFGISEAIETLYKRNDKLIHVFIRLNPRVEKQIYNGGNTDREF